MATERLSASSVSVALATTPFTARLERRLVDFIRRDDLLRPGERVVVAVSGGPDSTTLLVSLARLRDNLHIELTAAHFNHMLRSEEEAAADLDFVRSVASALDISVGHGGGDVRAWARAEHKSIEDAARQLRYTFLADKANEASASVIVTGHTIDDQAETILLHLIRGAGLDGVAGMRRRSAWPFGTGPELARPLLSLRREDTEKYCRDVGLSPRKDPTNDVPIATRNRLRRDVLPLLRKLNPNIDEAIARLGASAARDADYLDDLATHHLARIATLAPGLASSARADLLLAGPALAARVLRLMFAHVSGTAADLEASHIDALFESLSQPPATVSLPGSITAIIDSPSLVVRRGEAKPVKRIRETRLAVPGRTSVDGYVFEADVVAVPVDLHRGDPYEAFLDADTAGADLTVRCRRPGDRLRPLRLGGEKKLQDILVDAKVPAAERDSVPLVCSGDQIVWVVGHCIDERYALTVQSRRALHIVFQPGGDR
jgi:tRNA(Ile)-lysidine synthase